MFQNKKLKRNATYAIAEVALCDSNCALPTSAKFILIEALLINSYFNNEIGHEKIAQM